MLNIVGTETMTRPRNAALDKVEARRDELLIEKRKIELGLADTRRSIVAATTAFKQGLPGRISNYQFAQLNARLNELKTASSTLEIELAVLKARRRALLAD
jgi:hypothetical protein